MTHASNWRTRRYKPLQRERLIVVRQSWPRGLYTPWQRSRSGPARLSLLWARGPLVALTPTTRLRKQPLGPFVELAAAVSCSSGPTGHWRPARRLRSATTGGHSTIRLSVTDAHGSLPAMSALCSMVHVSRRLLIGNVTPMSDSRHQEIGSDGSFARPSWPWMKRNGCNRFFDQGCASARTVRLLARSRTQEHRQP